MNVYPKLTTWELIPMGSTSVFRSRSSKRRDSGDGRNETLWCPCFVLLLSMGVRVGQQMQPRAPQSPSNTQTPSSRSSYDPMARGKGIFSPKGWSKQLLPESIRRIRTMELWSGLVQRGVRHCRESHLPVEYLRPLPGCEHVVTLGNVWLLRQRQRRLAISANIVVQLSTPTSDRAPRLSK